MRRGRGFIFYSSFAVAFLALSMIGACSDDGPGRPGSSSSPTASDPHAAQPGSPSGPTATDPLPDAVPSSAAAPDPRSPAELIEAGRGVYNANCIACHAMDPRIDGALGPAVAGATPELIEARVLRGEYPAGYVPKRETRVMIPLPHLEPRLPELVAYLGSLK